MSMKRELENAAFKLAAWDVAKQVNREYGLHRPVPIDLEAEAEVLLRSQWDWYMERAARLWGRMQ